MSPYMKSQGITKVSEHHPLTIHIFDPNCLQQFCPALVH